MLRPHLTVENHEGVLGRARNARRVNIERLVAELAPRPDVPSSVRKVSAARMDPSFPPVAICAQADLPDLPGEFIAASAPVVVTKRQGSGGVSPSAGDEACPAELDSACPTDISGSGTRVGLVPNAPRGHAAAVQRAVLQPLSPERYRVRFTIGQDAYDLLRRLQTLLRREIPDGDTGAIFERALRLLHEEVEAAKFGRRSQRASDNGVKQAAARTPPTRSGVRRAYENRIRPGADPRPTGRSRYVPKAVKRAVWYRDRGQCAFVSASGQRCVESDFLELHHIHPYALDGPTTVGNLALRCRRHNQYESDLVFGVRAG